MKSLLLLVLLLIGTDTAHAIGTYTFGPDSANADSTIYLRTDVTGCLLPVVGVLALVSSEPAIEVRFYGDDTDCDPSVPANVQTPRFQALGAFAAGRYVTRVYTCGFGPQGTSCDVVATGTLIVQANDARLSTIPSQSRGGILTLLLIVVVLGARSLRTT